MADASIELTADPAPGPGARFGRGVAQNGGVLVFIDLWQAFGWFGADHWTGDEAAKRWPAIYAAALVVVLAGHNAFNWWTRERTRNLDTVTVTATPAQPERPERDPDFADVSDVSAEPPARRRR